MSDIKCVIAGGRDFNNYDAMKKALTTIKFGDKKMVVISGTAQGADTLGERYAKEHNLECLRFPAKWNLYGKRAGYIRNQEMCKNCDAVICFWDGKSRGTMHMINIAKDARKPLIVFNYDGTLKEYVKYV